MNVLFYTPVNFRCRDIESLGKEYSKRGDTVFLLSQCGDGPLHESFRRLGATVLLENVYSRIVWVRVVKQIIYLIRLCKKHNIQIVFSHLEPTNFISVLAQYFIRSRVIVYRHHTNMARLYNFDKSITYKVTYSLAKTIISVSRQARDYMIQEENVSKDRIYHINLGYDFSLYALPDVLSSARIRERASADVVLVSVGSLTKFKRPDIAMELVRESNLAGIDTSILFLGVGEEEEALRDLAIKYSIKEKVIFVGYTQQILTYLAASDLLIHPSISESSCVVIKEAGLVELPVIVCEGVGDFDDYMKNEVNGIVVRAESFVSEALDHLKHYKSDQGRYRAMGKMLKQDILSRFSIENVFKQYSKFEVDR